MLPFHAISVNKQYLSQYNAWFEFTSLRDLILGPSRLLKMVWVSVYESKTRLRWDKTNKETKVEVDHAEKPTN